MIKQRTIIFLTLLFTILIACTNETRPTPTPFAEGTATEKGLDPTTTLAISITDLAADPETFANSIVEITGRYQRLPLLICDTDANPAPASWQLQAEDGSVIAVGGFDSQLRSLLPNNLTMTVSGIWQLFEGPVGCGKSAASTQIWYLKVSNIISPSPITQVTLTPVGGSDQIADADGATAVFTPFGDEIQTPAPTEGGGLLIGTATVTGTPPLELPNSTATITAVPTTNGSNDDDGSSTGTPTPTRSGEGGGTATPTSAASPTTDSGSATATPTGSGGGGTGGNPTPTTGALTTATRNPNDSDNIEFDDLSPGVPVLELMGVDEVHLWPILFENNGVITITAVSEPTVDLVLEIIDPTDSVVQQANSGGNGALETIIGAQLNIALDYKIRIFDLNGTQGNYCLIFNEDGGLPDVIRGRIAYGETVQDQIEVLGLDYYCFLGEDGDDVTISSVETGSSGDFVLGLFSPPDYGSIGDVFQNAEIMNTILEEDGMYLIGVLNLEVDAAGYMLTLTKN
ncbi:hypothetical protein MNBD_CHLOROFLEXI01-1766 [hydrothermal vent metagenome]|uniref:Uncharacterized protein n=1 Tax=hydrothermal vent metagenome TaxID=652676 RepID=A0A3B0W6R3_9ZZZZ